MFNALSGKMKYLLFGFLMVLIPGSVRSGDLVLEEEIQAAVKQLGAAKFQDRQKAADFLWQHGNEAEPALRQAAESDDPEVRDRARQILSKVEAGLFPDSPPELRNLIQRYHNANPHYQQKAAETMVELGPVAYPTVFRLLTQEEEPLRRAFLRKFPPSADLVQAVLDGSSSWRLVRRYLYLAALDNIRVADYCAYLILTRQLETEIAAMRERARNNADLRVSRLLAQLYRTAGDFDSALTTAQDSGAEQLVRQLQLLRGDYAELARQVAREEEFPESSSQLGVDATLVRWAGNQKLYRKYRDELKRRGAADDKAYRHVLEALLINGELKSALDLAKVTGRLDMAFDLLTVRLKLADALALLESPEARRPEIQVRLEAAAIYLLAMHGEKERAVKWLEQLGRDPALQGRPELFQQLMATARRIDLPAMAAELALEQHERHKTPLDRLAKVALSPSAQHIWNLQGIAVPLVDKTAARKRFAAMVDTQMDHREKRRLLRTAMDLAVQREGKPRLLALRQLAAAAESWKDLDIALEAMNQLADKEGQHDILLALADERYRAEQWEKAIKFYRLAADLLPAKPLPRYLLGLAQLQLGNRERGREEIEQARLLLLGDARERGRLAWALGRRGHREEAIREWQVILRTADPGNPSFGSALRVLAREAAVLQDRPEQTASYLRLVCLRLLQPNILYTDISPYLMIASTAEQYMAWAARKQDKPADMMHHARAALDLFPRDADLVIRMVRMLEPTDQSAEGAEIFNRYLEQWRGILTLFPNSAIAHNNLAWVSARCQREPQAALRHAEAATRLRPAEAAYLDTLAEVHFQLGNREAAVQVAQKALALYPQDSFYQRRVKQFETAPLKSLTDVRE